MSYDKLAEVLSRITATAQGQVDIGFFGDLEADYPNGESVPEVAYKNEFGDPTKQQPPRPFMRRAIEADGKEWGGVVGQLLVDADYDGKDALDAAGHEGVRSIQKSIDTLVDPPLAKYTIEKKGHDKPLIDTGKMRESVNYKVQE